MSFGNFGGLGVQPPFMTPYALPPNRLKMASENIRKTLSQIAYLRKLCLYGFTTLFNPIFCSIVPKNL